MPRPRNRGEALEIDQSGPLASAPPRPPEDWPAENLAAQYDAIRHVTEALCEPLAIEDYVVQSMPDASPVKWHLAHTAWFFETFALARYLPGYQPFHPLFGFLFNSYYEAAGPRWSRPQRGLLSRPTVAEVYRYRAHVDRHMDELFGPHHAAELRRAASTVILGLHHEQQHQELIATDIKHAFWSNPLQPVYAEPRPACAGVSSPHRWLDYSGGLVEIGNRGDAFGFDNEFSRHPVFLQPFRLASRLVTCAEYLRFMVDGGYRRPEFWLSDGWDTIQSLGWQAPLYWKQTSSGSWEIFTMHGLESLDDLRSTPVCHLSYYEADAYAHWAGCRLPTEFEWEHVAQNVPVTGNLLDTGALHPQAPPGDTNPHQPAQVFGDVWEWTRSPYVAYPGYTPAPGALGEYNGKFMCNQFVLRGGSVATPASHIRASYRNFFAPATRWQFSGIRLAADGGTA